MISHYDKKIGNASQHWQSTTIEDYAKGNLGVVTRQWLASFCFSVVLAAGSPTHAATLTYDVDGVITGGGTVMGSFSLDQSTSAITALSIVVTPGTGYYGQIFGNGDQENGFTTANDLNIPNGPVLGELEALSSQFAGGAELDITFPYPSGGAIVTTTLSQFGESTYTISGSQAHEAVSGTVTLGTGMPSVPLPPAAPMFGAALAVLGALSYGLGRRKSLI